MVSTTTLIPSFDPLVSALNSQSARESIKNNSRLLCRVRELRIEPLRARIAIHYVNGSALSVQISRQYRNFKDGATRPYGMRNYKNLKRTSQARFEYLIECEQQRLAEERANKIAVSNLVSKGGTL